MNSEFSQMKSNYILFSIFLLVLSGCSQRIYQVSQTDFSDNTSVNSGLSEDLAMKDFIEPYKKELQETMDKVISYTPVDLPKAGFNSPLANLNCDMVLEESNLIYQQKHGQKIDMCLLNWGGIRRTFTKGNLTVKNVYELMPFENEVVVVTLSGEKVREMIQFLSAAEFGHPISGIQFVPNDENSLLINGQKFDPNRNYTVVTNDFLQKGGDQMKFFENPVSTENLGIKQRDIMMRYFEKHDTIKVNLEQRILK